MCNNNSNNNNNQKGSNKVAYHRPPKISLSRAKVQPAQTTRR